MSKAAITTEGNSCFYTDEFSDKKEEISFTNEMLINFAAPDLKKNVYFN